MPVIVKLTPNITDIRHPARAAKKGGADAVSLINTINSIMGVDLDAMTPDAADRRQGHPRRHCGPAVKPIALNMVAEIARDPATARPADLGDRRRRRPGATRPSSSRSAPATCRSAPRR